MDQHNIRPAQANVITDAIAVVDSGADKRSALQALSSGREGGSFVSPKTSPRGFKESKSGFDIGGLARTGKNSANFQFV